MSYFKAIQVAMLLALITCTYTCGRVLADENSSSTTEAKTGETVVATTTELASGPSRTSVLVGSLTVFLLAVFVGVEVITKVPPTLHTPLMSGSNAISGITIVGAILVAGHQAAGGHAAFGSFLGMLAVILAMINVVGGFLVTHRMLRMFKKR